MAGEGASQAVLVVKRSGSFGGSICAFKVLVNGKEAARLSTSERVEIRVPRGRHILGAELQGICPWQQRELAVDIQAGERRVFFLDVASSGGMVLNETAVD